MTERISALEWIENVARAACYGIVADWIVLWSTVHAVDDFPRVVAVAGFPLRAMRYPPAPMGGDYVPGEMLLNLVANAVFWWAVAFLLLQIPYPPLRTFLRRLRLETLGIVTALSVVIGMFLLMLRFD